MKIFFVTLFLILFCTLVYSSNAAANTPACLENLPTDNGSLFLKLLSRIPGYRTLLESPITIFLPPTQVLQEINNSDNLAQILLPHIATSIIGARNSELLSGKWIQVQTADKNTQLNLNYNTTSQTLLVQGPLGHLTLITQPGISCSNSIIYPVNSLLIPNAPTAQMQTFKQFQMYVQALNNNPELLNTLRQQHSVNTMQVNPLSSFANSFLFGPAATIANGPLDLLGLSNNNNNNNNSVPNGNNSAEASNPTGDNPSTSNGLPQLPLLGIDQFLSNVGATTGQGIDTIQLGAATTIHNATTTLQPVANLPVALAGDLLANVQRLPPAADKLAQFPNNVVSSTQDIVDNVGKANLQGAGDFLFNNSLNNMAQQISDPLQVIFSPIRNLLPFANQE